MPNETPKAISYAEAQALRADLARTRKENARMARLFQSIDDHYLGLINAMNEAINSMQESREDLHKVINAFTEREKRMKEAAETGVQRDGTG